MRSESAPAALDAQKSLRAAALFGLKTHLRQAVITSWSIVNATTQKGNRNAPDFTLSRFFEYVFATHSFWVSFSSRFKCKHSLNIFPALFYSEFMKNFFEMSPNAKSIFGSLNVLSQGKIVLRMIHVIAKAVEDPASGSVMLKKQAVQHVMYAHARASSLRNLSAFVETDHLSFQYAVSVLIRGTLKHLAFASSNHWRRHSRPMK